LFYSLFISNLELFIITEKKEKKGAVSFFSFALCAYSKGSTLRNIPLFFSFSPYLLKLISQEKIEVKKSS